MKKDERKGVLLRLSQAQYEKLRRISMYCSMREGRHISMQRILEGFLDATPDPSPASSETERAEAV